MENGVFEDVFPTDWKYGVIMLALDVFLLVNFYGFDPMIDHH